MSNVAIFKNTTALAQTKRPLSELSQSVASTSTIRRIQTNTNGTFRRMVGGEQIGKAIRGEFNAIIVAMLPKVSRTFYAGKYNPEAKPTLPDCWSNAGDVPDAKASNAQAPNCATCPNNVDGSGENGKGRACRFNRRVALMLEGDTSGDVYQFNIPAKSLFGKGSGNTHPFESYVRFLVANEHSIDYVVTTIAYDLDADTMEMNFTPVRPITDDEYELVVAAQSDPDTQRMVQLTVAEADGVKSKPKEEAAPAASTAKPAAKKQTAADTIGAWAAEADAEDAEEAPTEPVKRASKPKAEAAPKEAADLTALANKWLDDEEEDEE